MGIKVCNSPSRKNQKRKIKKSKNSRFLNQVIFDIQDKFLQDLIFKKFDSNRSGSVDFTEFVTGMSVITRGMTWKRGGRERRGGELRGEWIMSENR